MGRPNDDPIANTTDVAVIIIFLVVVVAVVVEVLVPSWTTDPLIDDLCFVWSNVNSNPVFVLGVLPLLLLLSWVVIVEMGPILVTWVCGTNVWGKDDD